MPPKIILNFYSVKHITWQYSYALTQKEKIIGSQLVLVDLNTESCTWVHGLRSLIPGSTVYSYLATQKINSGGASCVLNRERLLL